MAARTAHRTIPTTKDRSSVFFDGYDFEKPLKTETRSVRLGGKQGIAYHIAGSTRIENVLMNSCLIFERKMNCQLTCP